MMRQEEHFLLFLIDSALPSQRYELLHIIAAYPGIDSVTSKFMSHPNLGWEAQRGSPDELSKAFRTAAVQEEMKQRNILLLESIGALENFVFNADDFCAVVKAPATKDLRRTINSAIQSSIIRQAQIYNQCTKAEDSTGHASHTYHSGQIESWAYRILPHVIQHGDVSIAKLLLEKAWYSAPRIMKQHLTSILHDALTGRSPGFWGKLTSLAMAQLLFAHGAGLETVNQVGSSLSPIHAAARYGRLDLVRFLVEIGEAHGTAYLGMFPVEVAVQNGFLDVVDFLLGVEARSGAPGSLCQKPLLHTASLHSHDDVFRLLLARGADTSIQKWDLTPLSGAVFRGQYHNVKLLLEHGVSTEEPSQEMTPLYHAVDRHQHRIIKLLLEYGADTEPLCRGRTALSHAVHSSVTRQYGITMKRNWYGIIKTLLEKGAKVDTQLEGKPLLHYAIEHCWGATTDMLLEHGVDLEVRYLGDTLLWRAVELGAPGRVEMLLRRGADKEARDMDGQTLLQLAEERQHQGIISILQRYGCT
ncbi:uncharacterized protein PG998_012349 [Apiospora kogelbergensis]|uniref:Ankyrin repeat-containing protein n=1 Tax=Apiospora kogelbergensis TaxID=1337665 RepID=A0AAW0QVN5_9PEZI